jgi:hypothetical protein
MEICSQHAESIKTAMNHGERIASLETRMSKVEEVQTDMVTQLEEAANGLRALAGKIDSAVSAAKKDNGEISSEIQELKKQENGAFSHSLNSAFEHFKNNFSLFVVYSAAGGFVWFLFKTVTGDWKIDSNVLKLISAITKGIVK